MKGRSWAHQTAAVDFCRERRASVLNMGLRTGKTRVVIELWEEWKPKLTVIIAPKRVMPVWPQQFALHSDEDVLVCEPRGSSSQKATSWMKHVRRFKPHGPSVAVLNYESFWRGMLGELLLSMHVDLLVFDEVHKIKSPIGKASKFAQRLAPQCERVLGLSGTLMPHSPMDAWAVGMVIDPNVLGRSFTVHRNTYAIVRKQTVRQKGRVREVPIIVGYRNEEDLGRRLAKFCYSVDRDVLDLPPATHEIVECELSKDCLRIYEPLAAGFSAECKSGVINPANALVKFTRLAQLTGGWAAVDSQTGERVDKAKMEATQELIELAGKEPIVVFAMYKHDLAQIRNAAALAFGESTKPNPDITRVGQKMWYELSGSVDELDLWKQHGGVLACQIRSGGIGIDLTAARYCVFYSVGHSLGDYEQALARIHGPDRHDPVTYFHLVAPGTVDEAVYEALQCRKDIITTVVDSMKEAQSDGRREEESAPF